MLRYFDQCIFARYTVNACTNFEINRNKIDEFRKSYVLFDVTWNTSDRYFDQEHFEPTRSLYQFRFKGGFPVLVTLTFDLNMFYLLSHTIDMK